MQENWTPPASVDDLTEAMASVGRMELLRVAARRSAIEAHLSHSPGYHSEEWTVWVVHSEGSAGMDVLPQLWRDGLTALGWRALRKVRAGQRVADPRKWIVSSREDVEKLHAALVDVLSVGSAAIEPRAQLELSKQVMYDTAGYAEIGCPIALVSAGLGMVVGLVVAIIAGYPANSLDPPLMGKAVGAGLLAGLLVMMVATPSPRPDHPPSKARERAFLAVAVAVPAFVTLGVVLWLSIWSS